MVTLAPDSSRLCQPDKLSFTITWLSAVPCVDHRPTLLLFFFFLSQPQAHSGPLRTGRGWFWLAVVQQITPTACPSTSRSHGGTKQSKPSVYVRARARDRTRANYFFISLFWQSAINQNLRNYFTTRDLFLSCIYWRIQYMKFWNECLSII